jgi:hypothetical protein
MANDTKNEKSTEHPTQWATLLTELFDRLTGKSAEVTYNFQNLQIDMPRAVGPQGTELGSAKWVVNGRVSITAQSNRVS